MGDIFGTSFSKTEDKNLNNQAHRHTRSTSAVPPSFASLAEEYRRLAIDCLKVLRLEMQLETIFHLQVCSSVSDFVFHFVHNSR